MGKKQSSDRIDPTSGVRSRAAPIIERAPLPMVEVQGGAHIVSYVNSAFCRLLGKSRAEMLGMPFAEIVPGGEECVPILDKVYQTGEALSHARADSPEPNSPHWLYAMWPALDAGERPVGVIIQLTKANSFIRDAVAINEALLIAGLHQNELTEVAGKLNAKLQAELIEHKKTEAALGEANDELTRAQGVAESASRAKDDFLAKLSHELRTPLTPVLIAAAALREDERLSIDVREQLGMMERNIALEARLIDDLLDLTTISHGKLLFHAEPCDAHHLIGRAIEVVQEDARAKDIAIECTFTARYYGLMADPARFQQVMWNLLRNAVKFTPRSGRIYVRTRDERSASGGTSLRIEVADSGIGIDPARLEQIFLPFDQGGLPSAHRFGGVGLGLAIARTVVDLHGGRISAQSDGLNHGTTLIVELPGALEPPIGVEDLAPSFSDRSSPGAAHPQRVAPAVAPRRLLLVEDHESTLQILSRVLQRDGHHVVTASTVAEALNAAAASNFDLVISDLGLPDGSGTELMMKLRDTYNLRGIALSGYGASEDIARSCDAGFVTHLVKPVAIAELRRVIASFGLRTELGSDKIGR
jgi:signal transduction histidine kinase/ActR/RegA family two-component response regulator